MSCLLRSLRPSSSRIIRRSLATAIETPVPPIPSSLIEETIPEASTSLSTYPAVSSTKPRLPFHLDAAAERLQRIPRPRPDEVPVTGQWTPFTQRTGVIARKRGMTALWDQDGKRWPVTVLQLDNLQVIQHMVPENNTLHSLQLGCSDRPEKTTSSGMLGHFKKAGVSPKYRVEEFQVTSDAVVPVGTEITAGHFVPGQFVDVTAKSIGKGFQGVMKRYGFKGGPATHGHSKSHRSAGSTGQNTDPGRVHPGKKMAGHMGTSTRTTPNLLVHRIDLALNLIFVRGGVPGPDDCYVRIRDAKRKLTWKAQKGFRKGLKQEEWLGQGVLGLPTPAGDREMVGGWPEVLEWPGIGGGEVGGEEKRR